MAVDLMKCDVVGETEETFGYKTTPAGYLVASLCSMVGVSLGDHGALIEGATFDINAGILVKDAYGRTFRLDVTPVLVDDADDPKEPWRKVFRKGFLPALWKLVGREGYATGLRAVEEKLLDDDDGSLCQKDTTRAAPQTGLWANHPNDFPGREGCVCESACFVSFVAWKAGVVKPKHERATIGEVEEAFAQVCFGIDREMGEPAACRWFLNWFDETPMSDVRQALLMETMRALSACGLPC